MASLQLTIAKNERFGCLLGVNRKITALKDICNDPEKQEQDRVSTATARLEEAWKKYDESQQDVLGLVSEDQVGNELVIFVKLEEIYEAAVDETNKIRKKGREQEMEAASTEEIEAIAPELKEVEAAEPEEHEKPDAAIAQEEDAVTVELEAATSILEVEQ